MLVVQVAKEINELRYVLCPKRMTDAQFWQIYFQLAKKYLPAEAFDASFVPSKSITQGMTFADLQVTLLIYTYTVLLKTPCRTMRIAASPCFFAAGHT